MQEDYLLITYYKDITPDDIHDPLLYLALFPVMNKTKYIDNYNDIIIPEHLIPGQVGKVHIQSTSGSTGTPFRVPQDTKKKTEKNCRIKILWKNCRVRNA